VIGESLSNDIYPFSMTGRRMAHGEKIWHKFCNFYELKMFINYGKKEEEPVESFPLLKMN